MGAHVFDVQKIRKMLWWGLPLLAGVTVACWWLTIFILTASVEELLEGAPGVRLQPASLLGPFMGGALPVSMVLGVLRAIPYDGPWSKRLEWMMNGLIFAAGGVIVLIALGSTLIQNHYMPKLGYTKCTLLQGNPAIWFTDWVKNPDWCVRGKTREWVAEQARLAESTRKTP